MLFLFRISVPLYKAIDPKSIQRIEMKKEVFFNLLSNLITMSFYFIINENIFQCIQVRGHIVAAILRDVTITQSAYDSFIDLQDKLHQNIGRKRSLVSIGTHDLDTIEGPFIYDAKPPKEIRFKPLNQDKEYSGDEIMDLYAVRNNFSNKKYYKTNYIIL